MTFSIVRGRAEEIFGVQDISSAGGRMDVTALAMPWAEGTDGDAPAGTLGVLADNASGYAVIAGAPPGCWSVTTELGLDVFGSIPTDRQVLTACAKLLDSTHSSGYSAGTITDSRGRTLARIRQRGRYLPGIPDEDAGLRAAPSAMRHDAGSLVEVFGRPVGDGQAPGGVEIEVTAELVNPLGNFHGGIGLCLAEWMAAESFRVTGGAVLYTTSIHVAYLRPAALGTKILVVPQILHRGRTFGIAQVTVSQPNGKPVLVATVTGGPQQKRVLR